MPDETTQTRRVQLVLHKPWFALYWGLRPTVVIEGRGHPAQWGTGTWQLSGGHPSIRVFVFARLWRFGEAELTLAPDAAGPVNYRAPAVPFRRGVLR